MESFAKVYVMEAGQKRKWKSIPLCESALEKQVAQTTKRKTAPGEALECKALNGQVPALYVLI